MIVFIGDLFLGCLPSFSDSVLNFLRNSDYITTNFENVIDIEGLEKRSDKDAILTYADSNLDQYLNSLPTNHVFGLGNNHIHDLYEKGIEKTSQNLDQKENVLYSGVGVFPELIEPLVIQENDKKLALFFISSSDLEVASISGSDKITGILDWQNPELLNKIREAKRKFEKVITIMHVGKEYLKVPSIYTRKKAYSFIDAGADLVVDHHPHVVQGKEEYKGKWIYYSLGNYIFPNFLTKKDRAKIWESENNYSVALKINFSKDIHIEQVGLFFDTKQNVLLQDEHALSMLDERSKYFHFPLKKYFGLWENELYRVLKKNRGLSGFIDKWFPKYIDKGRLIYFGIRLWNKIRSLWI